MREKGLINNGFISVEESMTVLGCFFAITYFFYIGEGFLLEELKTSCELGMNVLNFPKLLRYLFVDKFLFHQALGYFLRNGFFENILQRDIVLIIDLECVFGDFNRAFEADP